MARFWIDFQGYCCVDAETKEQAEEIFWENITPNTNALYYINYQVDTIETVETEVSES